MAPNIYSCLDPSLDKGGWGAVQTNWFHAHGISDQYEHSHGLTQTTTTSTDAIKTSTAVSVVVMYSVDV